MYGEKTEEAQELRLDLEDVKEAYKMQIDQLLHSQSWETPPSYWSIVKNETMRLQQMLLKCRELNMYFQASVIL